MTPDCECEKCGKIKSMHVHHECDDFGCCHPIPTQPKTVDDQNKKVVCIEINKAIFYPAVYIENPKGYISYQAFEVLYKIYDEFNELKARLKEANEVIRFVGMNIAGMEMSRIDRFREDGEMKNERVPTSVGLAYSKIMEYQKKYGVK